MSDAVPWSGLEQSDKRKFRDMLNRQHNANLSTEEASEYYGNPEKVEQDFGKQATSGGPECPECFTPLYKDDIPYMKRTGRCPNCNAMLARTEE